jgi:hypothetical protein
MRRAVLYFRVGWQSCCLSVRALWSLGRLQSELFWRGLVYHEHIDPVLGMPTSGSAVPGSSQGKTQGKLDKVKQIAPSVRKPYSGAAQLPAAAFLGGLA